LALIPGWELPPPGTARWGLLGLEEAPHKVMDVFRMSFYLHHEQFGVAYEYFDPADIYHGARITVFPASLAPQGSVGPQGTSLWLAGAPSN
jgi:hypothetical protein